MNLSSTNRNLALACSLVGAILVLAAGVTGAEDEVDFNRDIKPLLSDRCFICHGPDAEKREADLRLDTREGAFADSQSGDVEKIIAPEHPELSELIARVTSADDDLRMPPPDSNLTLTDKETELLRRWVKQGAPWGEHWSFVAPAEVTPPQIKGDTWSRNEIDRFVLQRQRKAGSSPADEASREKLIRRLSFDLTGLPPTLAEIDAFLADESDDAYEKVVDRLLASDHFGERMAAPWLDAARYSDTYGYQVDRNRHVWPWRDWVVRSFNGNMPYDQFLTEQLAGDLLPDATDDQILATTFSRLHPQKVEGGSTPEEFRVEYVADRTQTFATSMLGLTMECCRCHDHKYDPISQREYYQMFAFFNNIDESGLYSYFTNSTPTPTLALASDAQKKQLAKLAQEAADAEKQTHEIRKQVEADIAGWIATSPKPELPGQVAHLDFEKGARGGNKNVPGKIGNAIQLSGDDGVGTSVGNFSRHQPFSVALWINTPDVKERAVVFHRSRAWTDAGSRGYQLLIEEGKLSASLIHFWPGNAIRVRTKEKIPTNAWMHVGFLYDGSSRAAGLKITIDGKPVETEVVRDNLTRNITGGGGDNIAIGERFRDRGFTGGMVDELYVFDRQLTPLEVQQLAGEDNLATAIAAAKNGAPAEASLIEYYVATANKPYRQALSALAIARQAHNKLLDSLTEIMVMRERSEPRDTRLLIRGAYDQPGESAAANTPSVLPKLPADAPANRLGLARWLTSPEHPLTSRVAVNFFWQTVFGAGLVRTPEDYGLQGEAPTHPELLDWLARDFVAHDWNTKRLMKQMVMSATYRQRSDVSAEVVKADPENRLLNRANSYRMPAEMLRDNALAVSGLLVDQPGGAPVRPYDLENSFKPLGRTKGAGLYRRSLYTFWKRTGPAPAMMALDASKRDVCRVRRERTSSPLQALVMLNGPQFVEAARALTEKLMIANDNDPQKVVNDLFRLLTSRTPTERESAVLLELFNQQNAYFSEHPEQRDAYLKNGDRPANDKLPASELAAFSAVANTLLSYDECVIRR